MSMVKAEQEGLVFEGGTADYWETEEVKNLREEAKQIKKLGFKAKVVKSNQSEWGCGDYVLMVQPEYMDYKDAKDHIYYIQKEEEYIKKIQEETEKRIQEIKARAEKYRNNCDKFGIKY